MKVAFDVQGTLDGPYSDNVVALFKALQKAGHECYIWSYGGGGMGRDIAYELQLKPVACISKEEKEYYYDDSGKSTPFKPRFDVCIDDDRISASRLDAEKFIFVRDIPHRDDVDILANFINLNFREIEDL